MSVWCPADDLHQETESYLSGLLLTGDPVTDWGTSHTSVRGTISCGVTALPWKPR